MKKVRTLKIGGKKRLCFGPALEAWCRSGGHGGSNYGGNSNFLSDSDKGKPLKVNISSLAECFKMVNRWCETEKGDRKYPYQGGCVLDHKTKTLYYDEPEVMHHILHHRGLKNHFKNVVRLNSWSFENGAPTDPTAKTINLFFLRDRYYECVVTTKDEIDRSYYKKVTVDLHPAEEWDDGTYVNRQASSKIDDLSRYTNDDYFYIDSRKWYHSSGSEKNRSYTLLPKKFVDGQEYHTRSLLDEGVGDMGATIFLRPKLKFNNIVFEKGDDGKYTASFVDYPNLAGKGKTKTLAIGNLILNSQHQMDLYINMGRILRTEQEGVPA